MCLLQMQERKKMESIRTQKLQIIVENVTNLSAKPVLKHSIQTVMFEGVHYILVLFESINISVTKRCHITRTKLRLCRLRYAAIQY